VPFAISGSIVGEQKGKVKPRVLKSASRDANNQRLLWDLDRMFFNDHPPPHFHARYSEFEATIEIATFEVMEGRLPPRALNLVQEWAMMH
jgi:Domain of unknown function (DUF4160)